MTAVEYLAELRSREVDVALVDGKLRITGAVTATDVDLLRQHEVTLVSLLAVERNGARAAESNGRHPDPEADPVRDTAAREGRAAIVVTNRELRETTDDALSAMQSANHPPQVFVRGGRLVRQRRDENGRPLLDDMGEQEIRCLLARMADWFKITGKGEDVRHVHVSPPMDVVCDLAALGEWGDAVPPLKAITEVPVLRPDGSILVTPGYDSATRLMYVPDPALRIPAVPLAPTRGDVVRARSLLLDELLVDFPFAGDADRANALALQL
ncbi:MAG: hypothetical protein ACREQ5_34945, partial [Candidatus Dormibacteria bacterium]